MGIISPLKPFFKPFSLHLQTESICPSVRLSAHPFICLFISLTDYLSIYSPLYLTILIHLFNHLFVCVFHLYMSAYPIFSFACICLSILLLTLFN